MITIRPFRNSDTPLLVDVWRSQGAQRGLMQPMSTTLFESMVLAKPYFDATGLLVATDGHRALGFAHAGFGPTANLDGLSSEAGVVSLVLTRPGEADSSLGPELVAAAEAYLIKNGAKAWQAIGRRPIDPFYLGLYGGSQISGVLESDQRATELFSSLGYVDGGRASVMQLELARFRPLVDRKQMQIRRRTTVEPVVDPPPRSWWDACTYGGFDRVVFELRLRDNAAVVGRVTLWALEPLASTWGAQAFGLLDLEVSLKERRQGAASFLVGEALRNIHLQGVSLVETHVRTDNPTAVALFRKIGFEPVDESVAYFKARESAAT